MDNVCARSMLYTDLNVENHTIRVTQKGGAADYNVRDGIIGVIVPYRGGEANYEMYYVVRTATFNGQCFIFDERSVNSLGNSDQKTIKRK